MTDLLDQNGQQIKSVDNIKQSVLAIERFVFCLNKVAVPIGFAQGILEGCSFLNQMHTQLLAQLSPEEIEEMKKEVNQKPEGMN